jgi:DNA-binding transcriptional LysR family regulator
MVLNLHLLRLFMTVVQEGGFSAAAAALHVSQPAISKGVRQFETQIGMTLLERARGGVRPTEAGKRLLAQAQPLFAAERAAEQELDAIRGLTRGSLALGASTTIATYLLPSFVGAFHRAHPAIEIRLTSANTRTIAQLLVARELDVGLVEGPVEETGLIARPWRREEMMLIAAPRHRLVRLEAAKLKSALQNEIFLVREPGSGTREVVAAALAKHHIVPRATIEIGSTEAIKQMVASGFGIAIVSAIAAADQIALGRIVVIRPRGFNLHRTLQSLVLPGHAPSIAAVAFNRLLGAI